MKIHIDRLDDDYHLRASNDDGFALETDASAEVGGHNKGMRPMQVLLASLGTCSSIDVLQILKKQREPVRDYKVEVTGDRVDDIPALFKNIHIQYRFWGDLNEDKVKRAVELSMNKYCSVTKHLEPTVNISYGIDILP